LQRQFSAGRQTLGKIIIAPLALTFTVPKSGLTEGETPRPTSNETPTKNSEIRVEVFPSFFGGGVGHQFSGGPIDATLTAEPFSF